MSETENTQADEITCNTMVVGIDGEYEISCICGWIYPHKTRDKIRAGEIEYAHKLFVSK